MSLDKNNQLTLIDEKNPLDTSNSIQNISPSLMVRGLEAIYSPDASIDMYALGLPMDTQKSSQFSDMKESHSSFDYKSLKFLEENPLGSTKKTTIEKDCQNNLNILIESLQGISMDSFSPASVDENFVVSPKVFRESTVYTNLSEDSHAQAEPQSPQVLERSNRENLPDLVRSKRMIGSRGVASIRNSTFALTNRIFCMKCNSETFTDVSFQMKDMGIWGNIGFFFTAIKCCGEPRALSRYQDIVHSCKKCGSVVARISTA